MDMTKGLDSLDSLNSLTFAKLRNFTKVLILLLCESFLTFVKFGQFEKKLSFLTK